MPSFSVPTSEVSGASSGLPTGTGAAFVAGLFDFGPPKGNTNGYVQCNSLADVVAAFGPRSSTNSDTYDWLDEYFNEGGGTGKTAFVTRVTDNTAVKATLTLQDGAAAPADSILATANSAGTEGNDITIAVASSSAKTFTATTTDTSPTLSAVAASVFNRVGVGTPISGVGIAAHSYITAVDATAQTITLSANATATATGVTITPGQITITVTENDSSGDAVTSESLGPFTTMATVEAATSNLVTFTAAPGTSNKLPATLATTSLSGGLDASDLTDASHVSALSVFGPLLGPGTVALPGLTSTTAWAGIQAHVNANNRWGLLDLDDETSSATIVTTVTDALTGDTSRLMFIQGSATIPALKGGSARTVAGSSVVAALRAQVARGNNQAIVPAGVKFPVTYASGFTTYYGPDGAFAQADVDALEAVGVNVFAEIAGVNCLWGFVSPDTTDLIYDQANAATARMDTVAATENIILGYVFDLIDLATLEQLQTDLNGMLLGKYLAGQFYDDGTGKSADAFLATTGSPVNTVATAQAKELNAQIECRFPRYADDVSAPIAVIPVSVSL